MTLIHNWETAKQVVRDAEKWNALPHGKKYCGSTFKISLPHCILPTFVRAGQQTCGGDSYWGTGKLFGQAMLKYLEKDWEVHFQGALEILRADEKQALLACQKHIDDMQAIIDAARAEKES